MIFGIPIHEGMRNQNEEYNKTQVPKSSIEIMQLPKSYRGYSKVFNSNTSEVFVLYRLADALP